MQVELPSGAQVILRDKLKAKDRFRVQGVMRLNLDPDTGMQETGGGMVNEMRNMLLGCLIQSWTVPDLQPPTAEDRSCLEDMDLDDYNFLADAVEDLYRKVLNVGPNPRGQSSS